MPKVDTDVADAPARLRAALRQEPAKVVVIDDDPTGTQSVSDVPVITAWADSDLAWALDQPGETFVVLTNSRSLPEAEAVAINTDIASRLGRLAASRGIGLHLLSRSDSTLRGHFPAETDALARGLRAAGQATDAVLLCPAFVQAGRVTIDDVHYVRDGKHLTPVAETEFARDGAFAYHHSDLRGWTVERGVDPLRIRSLGLTEIRVHGSAWVTEELLQASDATVVIVNATTLRDLEIVALGVAEAEAAGIRLIYRTGPSFVGVRSGQVARPPLRPAELPIQSGPGLLVVGSHTELTTRQLARALPDHPLRIVDLEVGRLLTSDAEIDRAAAELTAALAAGHDTALVTSRAFVAAEAPDAHLVLGQRVADAIVAVVRSIPASQPLAWVVAKGGITSSDVATRALGARRAVVLGQFFPGQISAWVLDDTSRRPRVPYVVFPGNVGHDNALADILEVLRSPARSAA